MTIIVISVLIEGPHVPPQLKGKQEGRFSIIHSGVFQAIGVISFAFGESPYLPIVISILSIQNFTVCHHNSLLIYGSLRTPTLDRFAKVTHISMVLSLVACATLAVSGYLVFTDKTQGNILNNFPHVSQLSSISLAR
jgi:sodium-coupled neutral amino acid transporter 11